MSKYFVGLLSLILLLLGGYFYSQVTRPNLDVLTKFEVKVSMPVEKNEATSVINEVGEKESSYCYIWGPFSESTVASISNSLKSSKLLDKTMITDRFFPDRFVVYLGPYDNPTAAKAFVKQFRQQGYRHVKAILKGSLSYGIEIASFETEKEANSYLVAGKAPMVKGIKVVKRLGEPSDDIDITLKGLTKEETEEFQKLQKKYPSGRVRDCGLL